MDGTMWMHYPWTTKMKSCSPIYNISNNSNRCSPALHFLLFLIFMRITFLLSQTLMPLVFLMKAIMFVDDNELPKSVRALFGSILSFNWKHANSLAKHHKSQAKSSTTVKALNHHAATISPHPSLLHPCLHRRPSFISDNNSCSHHSKPPTQLPCTTALHLHCQPVPCITAPLLALPRPTITLSYHHIYYSQISRAISHPSSVVAATPTMPSSLLIS